MKIYCFTAKGAPKDAVEVGKITFDTSEGLPTNFAQVVERTKEFADKYLDTPELVATLPAYWPIFMDASGKCVSVYQMIPVQIGRPWLTKDKYYYDHKAFSYEA